MAELSYFYPSPPPKMTIHIIALIPNKGRPRTPENNKTPEENSKHSPRTPEKDWHVLKEKVLRQKFKQYLDKDAQLPLWEPSPSPYQSHIAALKLPKTFSNSLGPSLLLHNLGSSSHDSCLKQRIENLFSEETGLRFLCNTSGAGKTRLLLEGLWRKWGFYITAHNKPDGIGSMDLSYVLEELESSLKILTDNNDATTLGENQKIAKQIFSLLLYIRMFIFRIYLETASSQPGGLAEIHKGKWLLLQVAPSTFLGEDTFKLLTIKLWKLKQDDIDDGIAEERARLDRLQVPLHELFCVLDEGQIPATRYHGCFLSSDDKHRPILRPIKMEWTKYLPRMIVSGTGMTMREVETVLSSNVAKIPDNLMVVTDIGAFDTEISHIDYLQLYFPSVLLDGLLFPRLHYWLCGRRRFTATYLYYLIKDNFNDPSKMLDQFICKMTGYRISDSIAGVAPDPSISFNFPNLEKVCEKDPPFLGVLALFVWDYVFTGKIRGLSGPDGDRMVEFGLSRFQKPREDGTAIAETDEPLAILALMNYISGRGYTLERCLEIPLDAAEPSSRGFAFEPYCAFILARAFTKLQRLSDIFTFFGQCDFKDENAELVLPKRQGDEFTYDVLDIDSNIRHNHRLGRSPTNLEETLAWLKDPKGTAFCFPAKDVGPDLICVCRLKNSSKKIIIICIQCKHTKDLSGMKTKHAIETTDPKNFVSSVHKARGKWNAKFIAALDQLGTETGTTVAGASRVLGVLISFPAEPDTAELNAAAKKNRIVAMVNLLDLKNNIGESGLTRVVASLASGRVVGNEKKRKQNTDDESGLPVQSRSDSQANKRQKTGEETSRAVRSQTRTTT